MLKTLLLKTLFISSCCYVISFAAFAQNPLINQEVEDKVTALMAKMTLEEKIGQLNQHSGSWDLTGPLPSGDNIAAQRAELLKSGRVGSLLNVTGVEATYQAQKLVVEHSRLGIPLLFGLDVVHGFKTIFPIPLTESNSWDLKAIESASRVAAIEASASGVNWTFAPMVDVGRDPRWGRVMEGAGEDPYLVSQISLARMKGFQTDDLSSKDSIMATAKHLAGYAFSEAGRDYNTVDFGRNTLLNVVLPPFELLAKEGVGTVMNAFNDLNGIPANADYYLQRKLLKDSWGFGGFIISDWGSIRQMINQGYSRDLKQAAYQSIMSGNDMDMESEAYQRHLKGMIESGAVPIELVDEAVRRVLRMKFHLGLFDDPYRYSNLEREATSLYTQEHLDIARNVAKRSIVLLNNDADRLPISNDIKRIAVVGHLAADKDSPIGNWRAKATSDSAVSLLEGIQNRFRNDEVVTYDEGYTLSTDNASFPMKLIYPEDDGSGFASAIENAKKADVVVMAVGEKALQSGEGRSLSHPKLIGRQVELFKKLKAVNNNIIVVLMAGRPIIDPELYENADTLLNAGHLGSQAGNAIADVLFGDYNPSGKLTMTIPRAVGQIPIYYNYKNPSRPSTGPGDKGTIFWSQFNDVDNSPQYVFGHGLSYTSFKYSNLKISKNTMKLNENVTVSVDVKNTGDIDGEEVVQLYIRDRFASTMRPVKELKGFEKVMIDSQETKTIEFKIDWQTLAFYGADETFKAEPGMFDIMVGTNSSQLQTVQLELKR